MKAVYLDGIKELSQRDVPMPHVLDEQVLIKMKAVGICGSDVHYWQNGKIGSFVVREPMILGHECAGVVESAGSKVHHLKKGDRVVIEPGEPCYRCDYCLEGKYNLCPDIKFFATPPIDGALRDYVAFDAKRVFRIPKEIEDFGMATLVEPFAVGVFATNRLRPALGAKAIVMGAGVVGLSCLMAAKAAGCRSVDVVDIREDRLQKAKDLGAERVINPQKDKLPEHAYDVAYEATGTDACFAHLAHCMKSGSKVALVGLGADQQTVPMVEYVCKEITLLPTFRYANNYPAVLDLICKNQELLKPLLTHRVPFSLSGVEEGLRISSQDESACKVIVEFE